MLSSPARFGLKAAALWTVVEFAIRGGLVVAVAFALFAAGLLDKAAMERTYIGHALVWAVGLSAVVLGWVFWSLARRRGLSVADLGYRVDRRLLLIGVAAGAALAAAAWATGTLAERLIPELAVQAEELRQIILRAGPVAMAGVLVTNGLLGPAAEELAWRGYIQHYLVQAWGRRAGVLSTALIFAAKHAVVDLSILRLPILVAGGLALGVLRMRWGTGVSTIAHVLLNGVGTLFLVYSD